MSARIAHKANKAWKRFMVDRSVTFVPQPMVKRTDQFFVMGSCFAEEIRLALDRVLGEGHVVPDLLNLASDPPPTDADADDVLERSHLGTYNAYSVLQEMERTLGLWTPEPDDYWLVGGRLQCPYRRLVFADTPKQFAEISAALDTAVRAGFETADHFVFTFGMTEVFINNRSGKIANQKPGYGFGGGKDETVYHCATFAENLAVITRTVDLITAQKPQARIFVTVSPVPLKRTFSGQDIMVANTRSKSTLRAVLAEVVDSRPNVIYFPSYEAVLANGNDAWEPDGRHVRRPVVEQITRAFVESYFLPA